MSLWNTNSPSKRRKMQDNFFLGPDANVRFTLQNLRAHESSGAIRTDRTHILNGISFGYSANGRIGGKYCSTPSNMLALSLTCGSRSAPAWQCMTITLGPMDLGAAAAVGLVARSTAPQSTLSRFTLRSGRGDDFVDQPFRKSLVSFASPSTHLDVIEIDAAPDLPRQAEWRDLILFFTPGPLEIELLDLRFFAV